MSIVSLMRQSGIVYPKSGYNKFGRDQSGTGVTSACRFQNKTRTKKLKDGQVIEIVGDVYLPGAVAINTGDRITIQGLSYKVFSISGAIDGKGNQRLIKCEVERWQI